MALVRGGVDCISETAGKQHREPASGHMLVSDLQAWTVRPRRAPCRGALGCNLGRSLRDGELEKAPVSDPLSVGSDPGRHGDPGGLSFPHAWDIAQAGKERETPGTNVAFPLDPEPPHRIAETAEDGRDPVGGSRYVVGRSAHYAGRDQQESGQQQSVQRVLRRASKLLPLMRRTPRQVANPRPFQPCVALLQLVVLRPSECCSSTSAT